MSQTFKQKALNQLGAVLKQLRLEKGITLTEISTQTDLSIRNIMNIESGCTVAYDKYKKLLGFYHKTFEVVVVDLKN